MSKTKIVGILIIVAAVLKTVVDAIDGNGFEIMSHWNDVVAALVGAGIITGRQAITKLDTKIDTK